MENGAVLDDPNGSGGLARFMVNGAAVSAPPATPLLGLIRGQLGLTGAKAGCGEGECGACVVLVDGAPVTSCQATVGAVNGCEVTTVEGLAADHRLHPVQVAFAEVGVAQCGYCMPGMVLAAASLLARTPEPTDADIDTALAPQLCRCGTYPAVRRAVHRAATLGAAPGRLPDDPPGRESARWGPPTPDDDPDRPARPWSATDPAHRDWFDHLGDGLIVVVPPDTPSADSWTTASGGAWLHVAPDSLVTAFTGKVDVGQDNTTALRMLVAEELRVPVTAVRLAMGDTDRCPYDMGTFGSRSMPDAGGALRRAAAHARRFLPVAPGSRRVEVAPDDAAVSDPATWTLAGHPLLPADLVDALTGARRFTADLTAVGLRYGVVLHPPVPSATLRHLDASEVDPAVLVVERASWVGLVADDPASARAALAAVTAQWDLTEGPTGDHELEAHLRAHPVADRTESWDAPFVDEVGDPERALADSALRLDATYTTSYLAHAPIEPRAALARWDGERVTVWTGTQTPFAARTEVAIAAGIGEDDVRILVPPTGGAFGGKHAGQVAAEAAILARAAGAPVRVVWTRTDEFTAGTLRPAAVIDVSAGVHATGILAAWSMTDINAGAAALAGPYRSANQRLEYRSADAPLPQGPYRALAATANTFARESHIDELALALDRDPVSLRLDWLSDERLARVVQLLAERIRWPDRTPDDGWGIACGLEKNGRVATAARVGRTAGGILRLQQIVTVYDCGAVVNPATVIAQIEGATVMALGGACFERIRVEHGRVANPSFATYRLPRFNDVPPIDVVLAPAPGVQPAGAGETPMIAVAPAIANAVRHLTDVRIRSLPLTDGISGTEAAGPDSGIVSG